MTHGTPPRVLPVVRELTETGLTVTQAVERLAGWPHLLALESSLIRREVGRYSFVTADPCEWHEPSDVAYASDPFASLRERCAAFTADHINHLPPFQGGAAGLIGYECRRAWERLPSAKIDEFRLPPLAVGIYDWVIAWDHERHRVWLISQGFPEVEPAARYRRAAARANSVQVVLAGTEIIAHQRPPAGRLPMEALAPQHPVGSLSGLTSSFSREDYLRAVTRVIEYIRAGDIFQANLSQRLLFPADSHPLDVWRRLRAVNRAPFGGLLMGDNWSVISASPERFLSVRDRHVETRPIKGTRRRSPTPVADLLVRDELRESLKDRAENVMIVDLLRNDLSRACRPGSISVPVLFGVETYETVQHLVSVVRGELAAGKSVWDLLGGAFPGGSITGAPKIRAMEIIAELEPTVRGPYTGSLFYVGFDGWSDSNILIRSFVHARGWLQCHVGGGIVADSQPELEYRETLHKAEGMLRALV